MVVAITANSEDATDKTGTILKKLEDLHSSIVLKMNVIVVKAFDIYQ